MKISKDIWRTGRHAAIAIFILLLVGALAIIFSYWQNGVGPFTPWWGALNGLGYALSVSAIVYALQFFLPSPSDVREIAPKLAPRIEILDAIENAKKRIWFWNTWIHRNASSTIADKLTETPGLDVRLLQASMATSSSVHSRVLHFGKPEFSITDVCTHIASAANEVEICKPDTCRFFTGLPPCWMVVVDSTLYWGIMPVDSFNWRSKVCNQTGLKYDIYSDRGQYLVTQFQKAWTAGTDLLHKDHKMTLTFAEEALNNIKLSSSANDVSPM